MGLGVFFVVCAVMIVVQFLVFRTIIGRRVPVSAKQNASVDALADRLLRQNFLSLLGIPLLFTD